MVFKKNVYRPGSQVYVVLCFCEIDNTAKMQPGKILEKGLEPGKMQPGKI